MKYFALDFKISRMLAAVVIAGATLTSGNLRAGQETGGTIPLIVMDSVPLLDAIRNLAAQAGSNYIIAPDVIYLAGGTNGAPRVRQPDVTVRWENLSAEQALAKLLAERRLAQAEIPETPIKRISHASDVRKSSRTAPLTGSTNEVVPLMVLDDVPLDQAILQLAKTAHLSVTLDPQLSNRGVGSGIADQWVSVRWNNVTAGQGLAALFANYDLEMSPADGEGVRRIGPREKTGAKPQGAGVPPSADK